MDYVPGKPLILSRLPARDWFSLDEAAAHSGWGRTFIREQILGGRLPAQKCSGADSRRAGKNHSYRVHVDDLVMFILRNGRYSEEKTFADAAALVRQWPAWMRRELAKVIERSLTPSGPRESAAAGPAASPGGEAAHHFPNPKQP